MLQTELKYGYFDELVGLIYYVFSDVDYVGHCAGLILDGCLLLVVGDEVDVIGESWESSPE